MQHLNFQAVLQWQIEEFDRLLYEFPLDIVWHAVILQVEESYLYNRISEV